MSLSTLKSTKEYTVPGKQITWNITKHLLELNIGLNWLKYEGGGLVLPPASLGRCKDWRNVLNDDTNSSVFTCTWDLRRVDNKLEQIDEISDQIAPFAWDS